MIVYRVDHGEVSDPRTGMGCGPYAGAWYLGDLLDDRRNQEWSRGMDQWYGYMVNNHRCEYRTPSLDPELKSIKAGEVCGLASREAVVNWFGKRCLGHLEAAGFRVAKYDVPDECVRHGRDGQVLFEARKAKEIK